LGAGQKRQRFDPSLMRDRCIRFWKNPARPALDDVHLAKDRDE